MKYRVTIGLAVSNILVFLFFAWKQDTLMFSDTDDFLFLFWHTANFNPLTLGGEPWRVLTSMFMHANILHLLVNMYALYNIAHLIEREDGSLRLFLIYVATGVFAGLASLIFNLFSISVGASGAIFGLYGYHMLSQLATHWNNRGLLFNILINFILFAVINYFIASHILVDTAGHIGGLISGAFIGVVKVFDKKLYPITLAFIFLGGIVTFAFLPRNQVRYFNVFQSIIKIEDDQREVYNQKLNDNQLIDSLKSYFNRWSDVYQQLKALPDVPAGLQHDTTVLNDYIGFRKNEIFFRIKMIERESYIYLDSIEHVFHQFDTLSKLHHVLNYRNKQNEEPSPDSVNSNSLPKVRVFYDQNWIETPDEYKAAYFRLGHRDSLGRWQGKVYDHFIDGSIQMKGRYLNGMHHGVFIYYTEDKKYQSAGVYEKDYPTGKWEYFYPNGKLHREVVYAAKVYTRNVYDTTGNLQVENGNGKQTAWYANGNIREEGLFENGWKQGVWRGYHENGVPYYEEFYRDNILVRGRTIDRFGNRYVYDQSSLYAAPDIGFDGFRNYVQKNVRKDKSFTTRSGK